MSEPLPPIEFLAPSRRRRWWGRLIWALPWIFCAMSAAGLVLIARGWR